MKRGVSLAVLLLAPVPAADAVGVFTPQPEQVIVAAVNAVAQQVGRSQ